MKMAWYQYGGKGQFLSEDSMEDITKALINVLYDLLPEGIRSVEVMESVLEHTKEKIQTCEIVNPSNGGTEEKWQGN